MSEIVINTESNKIEKKALEPFKLVEPSNGSLHARIEEYNVSLLPNPVMSELIERMKMTMKLYGGVGLSANQCGVQQRVFIAGTDQFQMVCINPKIIKTIGESKKKREGCLTYPGLYLNIPRYESVEVEYYTESGEKKNHTFDGVTAHIFQHEYEHMEGITFTTHVGPVALKLAVDRQNKLIKKMIRKSK
jgi:peptide deformylase